MITIAIIHILSWILAAVCKAVMDTLQFHFEESIFNRVIWMRLKFWWPEMSWKNKYKNGDPKAGPRFLLSTTVFVFLTDAWHLFQFGMNFFITLALVTGMYLGSEHFTVLQLICMFIGYRILFSGVFQLFYGKVFLR